MLIHGKDIVVFGKGFRSGTSYTYISIAAKRAQDILHVTARDLTGDGKAEIIVRLDLPTKTSKEFGEVLVHRRTLIVYKVGEQGLTRIFAAETSRKMEGKRIVGALKFIQGKKGYELELRSGTAKGWTQKTYPFPVETATSAGFEPLLVPWGALRKIPLSLRRFEVPASVTAVRSCGARVATYQSTVCVSTRNPPASMVTRRVRVRPLALNRTR